jgi:hypothetical protein
MSLKDSLKQLFDQYSYAVVTARGGSAAVWRDDKHFYYFDPHGCDENGEIPQEFILFCWTCFFRPRMGRRTVETRKRS